MFPTTLYSMRKQLKLKSPCTTYVVCPKCHTLYKKADCFKTRSDGSTTTLWCTHIKFPNHPRSTNRKECGTELMIKVKTDKHTNLLLAQAYRFVPVAIETLGAFGPKTLAFVRELGRRSARRLRIRWKLAT